MIAVDICVCTFRRPQLEQTVRSIGDLIVPPHVTVRIVVADNDVTPSARDLVHSLASRVPHEIVYVHAPARNISIARNACLDNSHGDFVAFVDDDETVSANWLRELLEVAAGSGAEAVLGPVKASYGAKAPAWMRQGDFHSTFPVWVGGQIRTGYTCNVLLRRTSPAVESLRFDLALGQSGGEDTEYFTRLHEAGGVIAHAPRAWVHETVPQDRAKLSWLAKRRFRMGQTHGRLIAARRHGAGRVVQLALASAKSGCCFAAAACLAAMPARRNAWLLRGIMHTGVVGALLGLREIRQYGEILPEEASGHAA